MPSFSVTGRSFSIHEWRGSGPAILHVHHSDDEAWHVLEGQLTFRYADRTETAGPGDDGIRSSGYRPHIHCRKGRPLSDPSNTAIECSHCCASSRSCSSKSIAVSIPRCWSRSKLNSATQSSEGVYNFL